MISKEGADVVRTITSNKSTEEKKSEKPLEVSKRAIDIIRRGQPQDQSKNHISKSNLSSPEIFLTLHLNEGKLQLLHTSLSKLFQLSTILLKYEH